MSDHFDLRDKTVVVTGGHGFIGRHVVRALDQEGAKPVSIAQSVGAQLPDLPGETLHLDLEQESDADRAVATADVVVHLAARAGGIQFQQHEGRTVFDSNRLITNNVMNACRKAGVSRLFLSSSLVTYRESSAPIAESGAQLGPGDRPSPYAWSKITDEVASSWHGEFDTIIGRFGNVYGPGASFEPSRSTVVHALIDRAARLENGEKLTVWGDGRAMRSFVFVGDAARGVLLALTRGGPGEAYNIDSGEPVTIAQAAEIVRDQVNPSLTLDFDTSKPAGSPFRVASIDKLASLGYAPAMSLIDGVRATTEWYRSQRPSS